MKERLEETAQHSTAGEHVLNRSNAPSAAVALLLVLALGTGACGAEEGGKSNDVDTSANNTATSQSDAGGEDGGTSEGDASTSMMDSGDPAGCLSVPAELLAPETINGETSTVDIELENCGEVELVVTPSITGDAEWTLDDASVTLAAGETATVVATYSPTVFDATSEAVVFYAFGEGAFSDTTALSGIGALNPENCPAPVIQAREVGETMWQAPLTTKSIGVVEFDATTTTGAAEIVDYAWSVVGAPTDSMATFADATMAATTLDLDYPGTYTVELSVEDAEGRRCGPARFQFVAVAVDGVVIELEWDTVGGAGASSANSDLDLYMAPHMANGWENTSYSLWWRYPSRDWGLVPSRPAIVELLSDSEVDGKETIRAEMLPARRYYIGVRVFAIDAATPSYEAFATVRVFVDGAKQFEVDTSTAETIGVPGDNGYYGLRRGEFWTAVAIDWTQNPPMYAELRYVYDRIPSSPFF